MAVSGRQVGAEERTYSSKSPPVFSLQGDPIVIVIVVGVEETVEPWRGGDRSPERSSWGWGLSDLKWAGIRRGRKGEKGGK